MEEKKPKEKPKETEEERRARIRKKIDSYGFFPPSFPTSGKADGNKILINDEEFNQIRAESEAKEHAPKPYKKKFQYR